MKSVVARTVAVATIAAGSALAMPTAASGDPTHDVPDDIPAGCEAWMTTVDADGDKGMIQASADGVSHTQNGARYPFVPQNLLIVGAQGSVDEDGNAWGTETSLAVAEDGDMHRMTFTLEGNAEGERTAELTDDTVVGHGWQTTEDLSRSRSHLYRLTTDGQLYPP